MQGMKYRVHVDPQFVVVEALPLSLELNPLETQNQELVQEVKLISTSGK
jgi:hypothetical protein